MSGLPPPDGVPVKPSLTLTGAALFQVPEKPETTLLGQPQDESRDPLEKPIDYYDNAAPSPATQRALQRFSDRLSGIIVNARALGKLSLDPAAPVAEEQMRAVEEAFRALIKDLPPSAYVPNVTRWISEHVGIANGGEDRSLSELIGDARSALQQSLRDFAKENKEITAAAVLGLAAASSTILSTSGTRPFDRIGLKPSFSVGLLSNDRLKAGLKVDFGPHFTNPALLASLRSRLPLDETSNIELEAGLNISGPSFSQLSPSLGLARVRLNLDGMSFWGEYEHRLPDPEVAGPQDDNRQKQGQFSLGADVTRSTFHLSGSVNYDSLSHGLNATVNATHADTTYFANFSLDANKRQVITVGASFHF
jgi:hypothetical protein